MLMKHLQCGPAAAPYPGTSFRRHARSQKDLPSFDRDIIGAMKSRIRGGSEAIGRPEKMWMLKESGFVVANRRQPDLFILAQTVQWWLLSQCNVLLA